MKNLNWVIDLMVEESFGSLNLRRLSELRYPAEPNRQPECVESTEPTALFFATYLSFL